MKREHAEQIAALAEEYAAKLNSTLAELRAECSEEEVNLYAEGIAQVQEHLHDDILAPIYREHPDLRRA